MTDKNIDALAPVSNTDANGKFIQKRRWVRFEIGRLCGIFLKRKRQDKEKALSNAELFVDDWLFHNGKTWGELTQAERSNLISDTIARVTEQHNVRAQQKEDAEFRAMQGSLGDGFDGEPFTELPGDDAFERAIVKHQKKLKP